MSIRQWALFANSIGLDAIDLSNILLKNNNIDYLKELHNVIVDAGVHVAVLNTYPDFTHPSRDERKRQISKLKEDIHTAAILDAKMIRVTAGQAYPETSRENGIAWTIEGLKHCIEAAEQHGVKLAYENHSKPGIWDYSDFSHPTDIFLEIFAGISKTQIGILFDTANPLAYGDEPVPVLEQVIDHVICVHAADIRDRGTLEPVLVGTGIVPFKKIFEKLKGSGYNGWISIEEASGLGRNGVADAVRFVRRVWEDAVISINSGYVK
jgi:Sugar phosphate isomerases/epimerases